MGFLDNSSITVDAILTKRGREILSEGGDLAIVKFALSDEEVDYGLYDVTHPNGTDSYGAVIENMSLLEATPARTNFRSFLVNQSLGGAQVTLDSLNYTSVDTNANIALNPSTIGGAAENYTFTIENTNIVKFSGSPSSTTTTASSTNLVAQSISTAGTTTVTIIGTTSGIVNVVTISVKADPTSNQDPTGPKTFKSNKTVTAGSAPTDAGGTGGASY
ncbi:MAG: hypothetical protein CBE35_00865 [Candidatus Pelagibacter sp. TMED275]|nr:MAG: hypothetical protein CBE35_00865 [Candidatus Pelagibacter sp. TMED275]|tara:strand:+ start:2244 stop:2897 length:654 start_codon:yes stop_codon:yes gene_type:complete